MIRKMEFREGRKSLGNVLFENYEADCHEENVEEDAVT
jgi:hypothetical protein